MKITIESTTKVVTLNGVECRIWEGTTEKGIPMHAFIALVAVQKDLDAGQFEPELREMKPPSPEVDRVYPLRMIL